MTSYTREFSELPEDEREQAGGKGSTLARLYQAGYPVPPGFVVLPGAFSDDHIIPEAWDEVARHLSKMRTQRPGIAFAVRSSAQGEDSERVSFAGVFETVLDVQDDASVLLAIEKVRSSRHSVRAAAYKMVVIFTSNLSLWPQ